MPYNLPPLEETKHMSKDYIVRAMAADGNIRAFGITTKNLTEEARKIHNYLPLAIAALGRTLTGALLLGDTLKSDTDLVTLFIKGDGPLKQLLATADSHGHVKGYCAVPDVYLPSKDNGHFDVGKGIGQGTLTVIKDLGMKEPYVGSVDLVDGEIADDLTYYFAKSEQTPTSIGLGVLVDTDFSIKAAGGFMVQLLPNTPDEVIQKLENNLKKLNSVTDLLIEHTPEGMLEIILEGFDVEFTETKDVSFRCDCSKERTASAIKTLGRKEIEDMIEKDKGAEVNCDFCGKKYEFSIDELKAIAEQCAK